MSRLTGDEGGEISRRALVIEVPALEPIVARWRDRPGDRTPRRMPAHLTVMYPFLNGSEVATEVRSQLVDLCRRTRAFNVSFASTATFPGVVYLVPSPADAVRLLTERVIETWPQLRPYGGIHADIVPHLTLAYTNDDAVVRRIANELEAQLPINTRLTEASVFLFDGTAWRLEISLPFRRSRRVA